MENNIVIVESNPSLQRNDIVILNRYKDGTLSQSNFIVNDIVGDNKINGIEFHAYDQNELILPEKFVEGTTKYTRLIGRLLTLKIN
jgi:hypothetical protein